jgi:hypothetical protein
VVLSDLFHNVEFFPVVRYNLPVEPDGFGYRTRWSLVRIQPFFGTSLSGQSAGLKNEANSLAQHPFRASRQDWVTAPFNLLVREIQSFRELDAIAFAVELPISAACSPSK